MVLSCGTSAIRKWLHGHFLDNFRMEAARKRIVVLGGGFAGVCFAKNISDAHVTVVNRSPVQTYTPWLYEVASGKFFAVTKREGRALGAKAEIPLKECFRGTDIHLRIGEVDRIDQEKKVIFFTDGLTLSYDVLVVALGTVSNDFGIPGIKEYAVALKSGEDAMEVRTRIMELMKTEKKNRTVIVAGAGPSGVELASELQHVFRMHDISLNVMLLDRSGVLASFGKKLSHAARRGLKNLDVKLKEHLSLVEVKKDSVILRRGGGELLTEPCDLLVWTGGVKVGKTVSQMPFGKDKGGRIMIDNFFKVQGARDVYALGDCALMGERKIPQSLEAAVAEGFALAENFNRAQAGKKPRPFVREKWNVLVSLGGKRAVGHVYGLYLGGLFAHALQRLADLRYFLRVLPFSSAWQLWSTGVIMMSENDR